MMSSGWGCWLGGEVGAVTLGFARGSASGVGWLGWVNLCVMGVMAILHGTVRSTWPAYGVVVGCPGELAELQGKMIKWL